MTQKTVVLAVAVLLLAGTSAALSVGTGPTAMDGTPAAQDNETTTMADETTTAEQMTEGPNVTFSNQTASVTIVDGQVNATSVLVDRAVLPDGGFVVMHAAENVSGDYQPSENLTIGAVLGNSTYLEPGVHEDIVVQLDQPLNESQTLVAMAHLDTNDNQEYEFPDADGPYTVDGAPVVQSGYVVVEVPQNETTTEA